MPQDHKWVRLEGVQDQVGGPQSLRGCGASVALGEGAEEVRGLVDGRE